MVSGSGGDQRNCDSESEPIVFRPSIKVLLRSLTGGATLVLAMLAVVVVQLYRTRGDLVAGKLTTETLVGVLILAIGWNAMNLWLPRLVVKGGRVSHRDRFGRTRTYVGQAIKGVALRRILWGRTARASVFLIIYGTGHMTLFTMSGSYWGISAITEVANRLGDGRVQHSVETTPAKLAKEFPGSLSFSQRHPFVLVLVAAVIFLAVMLAHP